MIAAIVILLIVGLLWFAKRQLGVASDLAAFDHPLQADACESFSGSSGPSKEHQEEADRIRALIEAVKSRSGRERLQYTREFMDRLSQGKGFNCEFAPVDVDGVSAEWVIAPGALASRRVLYIHGGAFIAGSPKSHRSITSRFSEVANAAVLAIDYRLMPEHRRLDGVEDCRTAYRWILDHGPDGAGLASKVFVSGDSAGGNLALMMAAWARDLGLHAPDAVIALSPLTDSTHSSPSILQNLPSDAMLGPLYSQLTKVPRPLMLLHYIMQNRMLPTNPIVSPLFGDLSGLPPILIQVSGAEMLLDDALRYVNKARASGTPAKVQRWAGMLHAWQIFYPDVPEAREAFEKIESFVNSV